MEVSVNINPQILGDLFDEETTFLKQIGINYVDLRNNYHNVDEAATAIGKIRKAGLEIGTLSFDTLDALMGRPEGERQLETACELIKFSGKESIPIMRLWPQGVRISPRYLSGRYRRAHRGGYLTDAFSLELMRKELLKRDVNTQWAIHFKEKLTPDEYFSNYVKVLHQLVPVAEDAGVKLIMAFDDPPVPDHESILPGITNPLMINRLFEAINSKNVGLLFCIGTRYESGVDIYEQIRLFRDKIFHVHFRNVRGTIPSAGGYEEVALDDGDMNMFNILKALKDVGYEGTLNPDHLPILVGDEKRKATIAFAVGYIKALISALS